VTKTTDIAGMKMTLKPSSPSLHTKRMIVNTQFSYKCEETHTYS